MRNQPRPNGLADPGTALHLPDPTGPHPVGSEPIHLRDLSRRDPWVPEAAVRELMVTLWYPADTSKGPPAEYMTAKESELLLTDGGVTGVPLAVLSDTRTNSVRNAPPLHQRGSLPLVLLSPGFSKPRATLTGLAEDLASHGYVVAAIDHTYESVATTFPDGRVATCASRNVPHHGDFWAKLRAGRAADMSFTIDQLTEARTTWAGARMIDPSRIGLAGHSAGGASSIGAMLTDPSIRAGINIDGTTEVHLPNTALSRPFLLLGRQGQYSPGSGPAAATWDRDWNQLTGWKRWLVVDGAEHPSFTDLAVLAEQIGLPRRTALAPTRAAEITRSFTRAFFDLHLKGQPQPLLDGPSGRYPEVEFARSSC